MELNELVDDVARADVQSVIQKISDLSGIGWNEVWPAGTWSPLHEAAAEGKVECAEALLRYGANVDCSNASGDTPLHLAVSRGDLDTVRLLLRHGANVDAKNNTGDTPILVAAHGTELVHEACMELLMSRDADVTEVGKGGLTLLHSPMCLSQTGVMRRVLNKGGQQVVNAQGKDGDSPLHVATAHPGSVRLLLEAGANPGLVNGEGRNPLHVAARWGHLETLRVIGGAGCGLMGDVDLGGNTVLHLAAQYGHHKVVRELIQWGLDVDGRNNEANTPLHLAAINNQLKVAKTLVASGANYSARNAAGKRPFYLAIVEGHLKMAEWLTDPTGISTRMVTSNTRASNRQPSLHQAIREEDWIWLLTALTDSDVDVNLQDDEGNTSLHVLAQASRSTTIMAHLLKRGASQYIPNKQGNLPMHLAALNGRRDVMHLLARDDKGHVQFNFRNKDGLTPLHFAIVGTTDRPDEFDGKTLEVILSSERVLVNAKSWKGSTPISVAASRKCNEAVIMLFQYMDSNDGSAKTQLFKSLYCEREDAFLDLLPTYDDINDDDGRYTLLQLSCVLGLSSCVELLLLQGADPNVVCDSCPVPPLFLAASWGYFKVIDVLLRRKNIRLHVDTHDGGNILHVLSQGLSSRLQDFSPFGQVNLNPWNQNYDQCIQTVLSKMKRRGEYPFFINDNNSDGQTPLHLAANHRARSTVVKMMSCGADPWAEDRDGQTPIDAMHEATLSEYLDGCVYQDEQGQNVVVDFEMFRPSASTAEYVRLEYFLNSQTKRNLLKHPVFASYLHFKYKCISMFCYLNLVFYGLFLASWSYTLIVGNHMASVSFYQRRNDTTTMKYYYYIVEVSMIVVAPIMFITWLVLLIRELAQLLGSFTTYICSWENYMELGIILLLPLDVFLIRYNSVSSVGDTNVLTIFIFFAWLEFVLLIGRLPVLAKYIAMFSTVLRNYLHIFFIFIYVLIGFVITFYLSFHFCDYDYDDDDNNVIMVCSKGMFNSPQTVALKMLSMMLGELNFDDLDFKSLPFTANLFFFIFLFFIVLVFMNLLNALAVSDTQAIYDEAELYSHISLVKMVCYIEAFFFGKKKTTMRGKISRLLRCTRVSNLLSRYCCCIVVHKKLWSFIRDKTLLFPKIPKGQIIVDLRTGLVVNRKGWKLPKDIVCSLSTMVDSKSDTGKGHSTDDSLQISHSTCQDNLAKVENLRLCLELSEKNRLEKQNEQDMQMKEIRQRLDLIANHILGREVTEL